MPIVVDVRDYRALYAKTRGIDKEISRELGKRLRKAGKIGADASRAAIRSWSVAGGISPKAGGRAHRGLRATIAAQIRVSASGKDVTIRSSGRGLTGRNSANLPRDIDRGGWYHPVFGRRPGLVRAGLSTRPRWHGRELTRFTRHGERARGLVFQAGTPYFTKTIDAKKGEMTDEVAQVFDDIARRL